MGSRSKIEQRWLIDICSAGLGIGVTLRDRKHEAT
jgi:hypothetical protein